VIALNPANPPQVMPLEVGYRNWSTRWRVHFLPRLFVTTNIIDAVVASAIDENGEDGEEKFPRKHRPGIPSAKCRKLLNLGNLGNSCSFETV
jgi:hypothetical protein